MMYYGWFLSLCNFLFWMVYLFYPQKGEVIEMDPVIIAALIATVGVLVTNFVYDVMGEPLLEKNRDHDLSGDWAGHRECRILSDWLLIYRIGDDVLVLTLARTGSHSDLFGK